MTVNDYIDFQDRAEPKAYLITIRTYGTWLHGDKRGSASRCEFHRYGAAKIPYRPRLIAAEREKLKHQPVTLDSARRVAVEQATREVCLHRGYDLLAINARTNHVHCVVSAATRPELIMNAFKAYATRRCRELRLAEPDLKLWSRHGSTLYLWTSKEVERAIDYVLHGQGDAIPFKQASIGSPP